MTYTNIYKFCIVLLAVFCIYILNHKNSYASSEKEHFIGCWEMISASQNAPLQNEHRHLPFGVICFSNNGVAQGLFVGENGLGNDMRAQWGVHHVDTLILDNEFCNYNFDKAYNVIAIQYCSYSGTYKKQCTNMNSDESACR